jgi:N-acetylglucosaminyl-diphospho-decaprenol L-rhamnosyltransferase
MTGHSDTALIANATTAAVPVAPLEVAVVILTYKSTQLAINCLRSVAAERGTPQVHIRAIVVDNASGDLPGITAAVDENSWNSWVNLVEAPRNGGYAYGNNLGVRHAFAAGAPNYIYLLNPDTEVRPGAIAALVDFLQGHPEVAIAGSSFENPDGSPWPLAFRFPSLVSEFLGGVQFGPLTRLLRRWEVPLFMGSTAARVDWICGASMLIRPAVLTALGGLDENYFLYFEETDFCRRALAAGFPTWYVPASRVMHIMGQSTQVTDVRAGPKRLPAYWFESRRRYFAVSFGIAHAILIDIVALIAHSLGWVTRLILRRQHTAVPYFMRDLLLHSILWPRNRALPAARSAPFTAHPSGSSLP